MNSSGISVRVFGNIVVQYYFDEPITWTTLELYYAFIYGDIKFMSSVWTQC